MGAGTSTRLLVLFAALVTVLGVAIVTRSPAAVGSMAAVFLAIGFVITIVDGQ